MQLGKEQAIGFAGEDEVAAAAADPDLASGEAVADGLGSVPDPEPGVEHMTAG